MADKNRDHNEGSLEDVAAKLSENLDRRSVDLNETSTARVEAGQVRMKQSAARSVEASAVRMDDSAAAWVRARSLEADDSALGVATAEEVSVRDSNVWLAAGKHVQAENVRTAALFAGRVDGTVTTLISPLAGLAIGAGFGLVLVAAKQWLAPRSPDASRRASRNRAQGTTRAR